MDKLHVNWDQRHDAVHQVLGGVASALKWLVSEHTVFISLLAGYGTRSLKLILLN